MGNRKHSSDSKPTGIESKEWMDDRHWKDRMRKGWRRRLKRKKGSKQQSEGIIVPCGSL